MWPNLIVLLTYWVAVAPLLLPESICFHPVTAHCIFAVFAEYMDRKHYFFYPIIYETVPPKCNPLVLLEYFNLITPSSCKATVPETLFPADTTGTYNKDSGLYSEGKALLLIIT